MAKTKRERLRRVRRPPIKDRRGLPARRVPLRLAARRFGWVLYCLRRSGIVVITSTGRPSVVVVDIAHFVLPPLIRFAIDLGRARRRNPEGVFALADEVFGTAARANAWMVEKVPSLGHRRPLDLLGSAAGTREVIDTLRRIGDGMFT